MSTAMPPTPKPKVRTPATVAPVRVIPSVPQVVPVSVVGPAQLRPPRSHQHLARDWLTVALAAGALVVSLVYGHLTSVKAQEANENALRGNQIAQQANDTAQLALDLQKAEAAAVEASDASRLQTSMYRISTKKGDTDSWLSIENHSVRPMREVQIRQHTNLHPEVTPVPDVAGCTTAKFIVPGPQGKIRWVDSTGEWWERSYSPKQPNLSVRLVRPSDKTPVEYHGRSSPLGEDVMKGKVSLTKGQCS